MSGCIQDDLSVCGLRVMFRYTGQNAPQDINRFASEVKQVNLYVFDADTKLFLSEQSATVEQMLDSCMLSLNIFPGNYTFVAWGNVTNDYEFEPFVQGQTTLDDAVLTLRSQDDNRLIEDYPDNLYFGSQTYTVIPDIQANQLITMDMVNNNKRIHLIARGLYDDNSVMEEDPERPSFHASITSKNGRYQFNNNPTGEQYTYIPPSERISVEEQALLSEFVVLRELSTGVTDSRLRVVYREAGTRAGEEEEFYEMSLTNLLLLVASATETTIENTDEFTVEILISRTNGTVEIVIDEWNHVSVPVGGYFGGGDL
jgi:hypothetical protein